MPKAAKIKNPPDLSEICSPIARTFETYRELPKKSRQPEDADARTCAPSRAEENARWQTGQISRHLLPRRGAEHYAYLNRVFSIFSHVNLLQRDMCPRAAPSSRAEVIAMTARMLGAELFLRDRSECRRLQAGSTSGGTESIIMPMLAYREKARAERAITAPEMVVPETIHPAFSKGAHFFGIKLIRVPVGPDYLADVDAMRRAITPNTIAIAGSAANYPHGLIDPIEKLSDLALEASVGLHVDSCFGGFILRVDRKARVYDIPVFDFRLPRRHLDILRYAQMGLRTEGRVGRALSQSRVAPAHVLLRHRLAGRLVRIADRRRQPLGRNQRIDVGCDGHARRGRLRKRLVAS